MNHDVKQPKQPSTPSVADVCREVRALYPNASLVEMSSEQMQGSSSDDVVVPPLRQDTQNETLAHIPIPTAPLDPTLVHIRGSEHEQFRLPTENPDSY